MRSFVSPAAPGVKVAATFAVLGTPAFSGQIGVSLDGSFGIDRDGNGTWTDDIVFQSATLYYKTLHRGGESGTAILGQVEGYGLGLGVGGAESPYHTLRMASTAASDNVLHIQNLNAGFHSVISFARSTDIYPGTGAVGLGNASASVHYRNRLFIATNPPGNSINDEPQPITIAQERMDTEGFTSHYRLNFATDKTITAHGWTSGVISGPVGWHVAADGRMGVGTSTLTATAQLTVAGAIGGLTTVGAGTISAAPGSYTITGVGTAFTAAVKAGDVISLNGGVGTVRVVNSATSITTMEIIQNTTTAAAYTIYAPSLRSVVGVNNPGAVLAPSSSATVPLYLVSGNRVWSLSHGGAGEFLIGNSTANANTVVISGLAPDSSLVVEDAGTVRGKGFRLNSSVGPTWTSGTGTPEAVVSAPVGSIFSRTNGGAATTLYVKESGVGNTGWVAK